MEYKNTNTENQANNRGFVRNPFRRPYHPPENQTSPNLDEGLTSKDIYSIFRALATGSQTSLDDTKENSK